MKAQINQIYQNLHSEKKKQLKLKNKYFVIIYEDSLRKVPFRKMHQDLLNATINSKVINEKLYKFAKKLANRARKIDANIDILPVLLLDLITKNIENSRKIINKTVRDEAESKKMDIIVDYINDNRSKGRWFYLASSHNDCAKDHKDYQGKLYYDNTAPEDIKKIAKDKNLMSIQWVMGKPAWFITRPYCRHYFVAVKTEQVLKKSVKNLKKKYKTHTEYGDRAFQTPAHATIEELKDKIALLTALINIKPSAKLKNMLQKCKMLLARHENSL